MEKKAARWPPSWRHPLGLPQKNAMRIRVKVTHLSYKSILLEKELKKRRMGNARQKGRLKTPDGFQRDPLGGLSNADAVIPICTCL